MSDFENNSTLNGEEASENPEEELISKTQLKKDALALKKFGLELAQLPSDKVKQLPIDETTLKSLLDYQKITTNLAKKRQLMYVGKCLRNEDEQSIRQFLTEQANSHLKAKVVKQDPIQDCVEMLLQGHSKAIEELIQAHPNLERQTLRQLVRNISKAKVQAKKNHSTEKLKQYLKSLIPTESR